MTVRVQEIGEGRPFVLIHGASVGGTSWANLVQGLSGFRCISADTAKQFAARLPQCTLDLVPHAGHAPWIDEPEHATASTLAFLRG